MIVQVIGKCLSICFPGLYAVVNFFTFVFIPDSKNVIKKKLSVLFLSAKITPRGGELRNDVNHIVPSQVPGLDLELSPRVLLAGSPTNAQYTQKDSYHDPAYTENRVLTPNKYRHHGHHTAEFGTQTGMKVPDLLDTDRDGVYSLLTSACCLLPTKGRTLTWFLASIWLFKPGSYW